MTTSGASFSVVRGVVSARKEQMHSVRVDRQTGYGRINTTPELWLRGKDGKEHRYQGVMFEAARPGHDVAVIAKRASGKPIAFANFTTGVVQDGDEMTVSTSMSSTLVSDPFPNDRGGPRKWGRITRLPFYARLDTKADIDKTNGLSTGSHL